MTHVDLICGDVRQVLEGLPERSVQTCITSPPYFGLRDYGHTGQIGLEATPDAYVAALVEVFRGVRRVLRDDGTLWLNLGDSYGAANNRNGKQSASLNDGRDDFAVRAATGFNEGTYRKLPGLKPKDLIGIPWLVAFALRAPWLRCRGCGTENHAMQWATFPNGRRICPACEKSHGADVSEPGWYLRSDIIWAKPNPMPESVTDRPTKAHEYLFLLTKSERYYYDAQAIAEEAAPATGWERSHPQSPDGMGNGELAAAHRFGGNGSTRNARTVWTIATQPYSGAHFATFPEELARRCILAGSAAKACEHCGAPWERQLERTAMVLKRSERTHSMGQTRSSGTMLEPPTATTVGWQPTCACENAGTGQSIVLDPFGGSGTTAAVAVGHGRRAIHIELNPAYIHLARERIGPMFCRGVA